MLLLKRRRCKSDDKLLLDVYHGNNHSNAVENETECILNILENSWRKRDEFV